MTVELNGGTDHDGVSRRVALIGNPPPAPGADLEALCRSIAELARTTTRPPRRIRLEHLGTAVEVEWPEAAAQPAAANRGAPAGPAEPADAAAAGTPAGENGPQHVCAPMLGTFYRAPEPGSPPYVEVGDTVVPGQPIGILEVMKMMSTVEADRAGTVVEILVPDATPVEFQQPLIAVEPATAPREE